MGTKTSNTLTSVKVLCMVSAGCVVLLMQVRLTEWTKMSDCKSVDVMFAEVQTLYLVLEDQLSYFLSLVGLVRLLILFF